MSRSWKTIKKILVIAGSFLGKVWTVILLGLFYWTLFAFIAIAQKIARTDVLQLRRRNTTWQPFEHVGRKEDWFKMY